MTLDDAEIAVGIAVKIAAKLVNAASHGVAAVAQNGVVARRHHSLRQPISQWAAVV